MKAAVVIAIAVAIGVANHAFGAEAPATNRFAAHIAPVEKFESGVLLVERHGDHGSPMILIPGLASGAWVWQDAVREFKSDHVVYVLTLPGFDGRPAAQGDIVAQTLQGLEQLITTRKLARPVLVGHSMGATLSLDFAEQHPDMVGGVVAIDGLPVFPGTENVPAAQRAQMVAGMKARMAGMAKPAFAMQQQQFMRSAGSIDMAKADDMAQLTSSSEPAAVTEAMAQVLALDLRPNLSRIGVPVLVIAPYFDVDAQQMNISEPQKRDYYRSLMAGTPKLDVVTVSPSRHFAMIDQPQQVAEAIRQYLKSL